jgi:hypothetical protein
MRIAKYVAAAAMAAALSGAADVSAQVMIQGTTSVPDPSQMFMGGGRQFKTGTGRIRGRVTSAEAGTPIRRAQVRISGTDVMPRAVMTDAEGRFEFRDLPAGRVTLQASKAGFVAISYGQTRPHEGGKPIELAEKQVFENADIVMPRGGVISGRILDEFGEPVPDVTVAAMRQTWAGGRRRLMPGSGRTVQTNDLGQYRVHGLPPGDYYITATLRDETAMFEVMAASMAGGAAPPADAARASGYAPTYFPGTPNAADAHKIALGAGQETSGTDFALLPVRLSRIRGIVMSSEGKPLEGAMISLQPARGGEAMSMMPMIGGGARTNRDGGFTLPSVPPGDYVLTARSMQTFTSGSGGDTTMVFTARLGGGDGEVGSVPLSVAGEDIPSVVLTTSKGGTASGRIVVEDVATPPNMTAVRLSALPLDTDAGPMSMANATAKADGTFEMKGMFGPRQFRLAGPIANLNIKAVRLNGVDVTDSGVDFKGGESVSGLEIVLTGKSTSIVGTAAGTDGGAAKEYTAVIFSENPDHWRLPMTRWVSGTRPDQEGQFRIRNLPAGTYYAIALDYIAQGEWNDPEVLERLRAKATRFTLDEGGTQTLTLKIASDY